MYTDLNLIFCDHTELTAFTGGTVGEVVDLNVEKRLGEGHPFYIYVAAGAELTATGNPDITIELETSNDSAFATDVITHPLFPTLHKADFGSKGTPLAAPCPFGTKRYARINMTAASALACGDLSIGCTFNVQTNA
jgi:hypothetical protein